MYLVLEKTRTFYGSNSITWRPSGDDYDNGEIAYYYATVICLLILEQGKAHQITGGNCTGPNNGDDGPWELEVVPESGSLNVSVSVLTGKEMIEYPLAVAPPLELFEAGRAEEGEAEYVKVANEVVRLGD